MRVNKSQALKGYFISIFIAMGMNIFSFPSFLKDLNPDWVLLVLIYWMLTIPEKIGVFNAWCIGLIIDVLTGRLLGQNALVYALIGYFCLNFHRRLRQYLLPQQSLFIFICLLFSQILNFVIGNIQGNIPFTFVFWLPVIVGTLCWPVVFFLLRFFNVFGRIG